MRARGNIQPGNYTTPVFDIPDNLSKITLTCDRNNWPDEVIFQAEVFIEINSGEPKRLMWLNDVGGELYYDTGGLRLNIPFVTDLPVGINRSIYANYSTNVRINSKFDVDLT